MMLNEKIRRKEKDPEGIGVGVGRKDSVINLHDSVNSSKFSPVVGYRCAYHPGEGRIDALTVPGGSMVTGGESTEERVHSEALIPSTWKNCLWRRWLGQWLGASV